MEFLNGIADFYSIPFEMIFTLRKVSWESITSVPFSTSHHPHMYLLEVHNRLQESYMGEALC